MKNWARRIKYLLLDTGRLGSLREIEMTDMRSILLFMVEFPKYKSDAPTAKRRMAYADQVDWL